MKLPVYIYGNKELTQPGEIVEKNYPNLSQLINDMFETMYAANGIGLAAHQIGLPIKLFVVDIGPQEGEIEQFKKVFINSEIVDVSEDEIALEEGCLSFPGMRVEIKRKSKVKLKYFDENFLEHEEWFEGIASRCIQHEHDHTEGIVFIKKILPLRRRLIQSKLQAIVKGNFSTNYKYKL